uniref:Uncharacterized protein n=1 Tax=Arundo donax TaxID=35708 RepID=A0A0A9G9Z7_ARUDO
MRLRTHRSARLEAACACPGEDYIDTTGSRKGKQRAAP